MKSILNITLLIILIFFCNIALSEKIPQAVKPEIVYDISTLDADNTLKLGVLFKLNPGWHIYWKNSGDSGLPTQIEFDLPDGFEAGELNWPMPHAYKRSGNVLDYGYEDEVLLWTDVRAPPDYKKLSKIPVRAKTKWVSCKEICIPGKADLKGEINLILGRGDKDIFYNWQSRLPRADNNNFNIILERTPQADGKNEYRILIDHKGELRDLQFFPDPDKSIEIESISYGNGDNNQSQISFIAYLYPGHNVESDYIDSVITYRDKENIRRGFEFPVKIKDLKNN